MTNEHNISVHEYNEKGHPTRLECSCGKVFVDKWQVIDHISTEKYGVDIPPESRGKPKTVEEAEVLFPHGLNVQRS